MKKAIWLTAFVASSAVSWSQAPELRLEPVRKLGEYPAAALGAATLTWDRSGVLWTYRLEDLKTHRLRLYRLTPASGAAAEIPFNLGGAGIPAASEIVPNLFAQGNGEVFFPVVWRDLEFRAAIARVSPEGFVGAVRLRPAVMARHVVVRDDGTFVVLGIDGGFFLGREDGCNLLHVYTADGVRLNSLSPCPDHGVAGSSPSRRDGVDFELLTKDVDHGQLWLDGDRLYHLLPATREIRIFSPSNHLLGGIRLQAPDRAASGWTVRRLFPLRHGYLLFWMMRKAVSGGIQIGDVVAGFHDLDGNLRSRLVAARQFGPLHPVAVTDNGELLCWEQDPVSGKRSLWAARVALRR